MTDTAGYFSTEQLLIEPVGEVAKRLHVAEDDAVRLRTTVQRVAAPVAYCAWDAIEARGPGDVPGTPYQGEDDVLQAKVHEAEAHRPDAYVSTGVACLDTCLGGGFAKGMVSELVGESSTGKTQLVLHTAAATALGLASSDASTSILHGGQGCSVALMTTHGQSSARHMVHRMAQMAEELVKDADDTAPPALVDHARELVLRNVSIACTFTWESAEHVLCYTLLGLGARLEETKVPPLALLAVDSIPPLLQEDSLDPGVRPTGAAHTVRAARLHALAEWLKRLAAGATHAPIAVLVVNHVSDAFEHDKAYVRQALAQGTLPYTPSQTDAPTGWMDTAHVLPLPYAAQAAHFSGLLASVPAASPLAPRVRLDEDLKSAQLGLVWSNCINARYLLSHAPLDAVARRRFTVVFSPTAASRSEAYYTLSRRGIHASALGA